MSFFFFNDTATTEIYTRSIVGSVRCVQETGFGPAGCVRENAVDFSGASDLTSFCITPIMGAAGSNSITLTADTHSLKAGIELPLTPAGVEDSNGLYSPLLTVNNGEVLGLVESVALPGVAVNRDKQRFDLWSASPLLPARFLTNLCRAAGIVPRIEGNATIYGAGRCFVVRADTEHDLVIYTRARLHNLASDSILQPENGIVKIPLKQSQTLLLLEIQQAYRAVWQSFPECRRKQVSIFITQMTKRQETLCYQCIFRFLCESCLY
eukprot:TRINITY_DN13571_c0_g1_i4.p1 TRINITY_DN13571_c0_g1~~TRINITY_DN13571_c0_g1_i4.p1  ORF type:complete len:266 (-),score=34.11 TRINITY_DN13571_c0_g1_i4:245-1042(-)